MVSILNLKGQYGPALAERVNSISSPAAPDYSLLYLELFSYLH